MVVGNGASSGGTNALVGVAISASLLPPVVNSGMCVAYGLLGPAWEPVAEWQWDAEPFPSTEPASSDAGGELLSEVAGITGLGYRQKLLVLGAISFALYLMNITVILLVCWCQPQTTVSRQAVATTNQLAFGQGDLPAQESGVP